MTTRHTDTRQHILCTGKHIIAAKGFSSVGRVSEQVGAEGFGCHYRYRGASGAYDGPVIQLDFVKMCEGMCSACGASAASVP